MQVNSGNNASNMCMLFMKKIPTKFHTPGSHKDVFEKATPGLFLTLVYMRDGKNCDFLKFKSVY
jgi:hypothetical protein